MRAFSTKAEISIPPLPLVVVRMVSSNIETTESEGLASIIIHYYHENR